MIRTQVYLPREIYEELRARAKARRLTMAVQIREALEEYVWRSGQTGAGGILRPDDPLFQLAGVVEGPSNLAAGHDLYLYEAASDATPGTSPNPVMVKEKPGRAYGRRTRRPKSGGRRKAK